MDPELPFQFLCTNPGFPPGFDSKVGLGFLAGLTLPHVDGSTETGLAL